MKIRPLGGRVLLRQDDAEDKTPGGIILPDQSKEKPRRGTVIAIGPGKLNVKDGWRMPVQVKEGDRVLFNFYGAIPFDDSPGRDSGLRIVEDEDLLGLVEDDVPAA